jgi:NitT/TauT family transport system permease protein
MRIFLRILPLVVFLAAWQIYATMMPDRQFYFSSPVKVATAFVTFFAQQDGFRHSFITFFETIVGFMLGNSVGISIGLVLWFSRRVADISKPYLVALGSLPIFALAPVMIVWFGIGIWSKIMMAALSTVIIAIVQSYQGAMNADSRYIRLMKVFKASRLQTFNTIILPSSLIWVFSSIKLNIGAALLGAFIGEFIAAEAGIGYTIVKASGLFNMGLVFSGCIILMMMALLLSGIVHLLERRFMRWQN